LHSKNCGRQEWYHEYGAAHPDWFAFVNGKRRTLPGCNMCVSNSEFQDEIVRRWWDSQKANQSQKLMINVKETDAQMRCQCPDCLAWDGDDVRGPTGRYALSRNVGERYARFYLLSSAMRPPKN